MTRSMAERRKETRQDVTDVVRIKIHQPKQMEIHAKLVDVSPNGFRAVHMYPELSAGQKVEFHSNATDGTALIVWNRIFEEHVETGFFILR